MRQFVPEKLRKVYLTAPGVLPIFVSEFLSKRYYFLTGKIKIAITLILVAGSTTVNWGQTFLWPGDVTNNGEVNTVDVLYWTLIADDNQISGPRRSDQGTDFREILIDELWETSFPNGLNHAYADCNGDGKIDQKDLDVIVANFDMERPAVEPDVYLTGIRDVDPPLMMEAGQGMIGRNQTATATFSLGSADIPVDSFFAIAITVNYNEDVDPREIEKARFELTNSWMGMANADLRVNEINEPDKLRSHFIISRKIQRGIVVRQTSFEQIGTFSIVMEDIATDRNISLEPTNTKLISATITETPVYPEGTSFMYSTEVTSTNDLQRAAARVLMYPNPTRDFVTLETASPDNTIQAFELYNLLGRLVQRQELDLGAGQLRLRLNPLPKGLYLMKVKTSKGFYTGKLKLE